jgi:phytoene dehydrogenase-like protein
MDATTTYQLVKDNPVAQKQARDLGRQTPSFSGFALSLALKGRTEKMAHHNVLFNSDYDKEFDTLFLHPTHPVADPTIYICVPDDATMRPDDDHESWFVLVNAPLHDPFNQRGIDWQDSKLSNAYADKILQLMADRGLDIRDRIIWREITTPADLESQTNTPGGAIYGAANHGPRATFLRPSTRSPIAGLYLVGGSAHPGGGLPLVLFSAAITANLIAPGAFVTQ